MFQYIWQSWLFPFIIELPAVNDSSLQHRVAALERELQWAHLKIQALQEELRQERIKKYGPRSETLSDLQLELLEGRAWCQQ